MSSNSFSPLVDKISNKWEGMSFLLSLVSKESGLPRLGMMDQWLGWKMRFRWLRKFWTWILSWDSSNQKESLKIIRLIDMLPRSLIRTKKVDWKWIGKKDLSNSPKDKNLLFIIYLKNEKNPVYFWSFEGSVLNSE